jgi:hypothetical protein
MSNLARPRRMVNSSLRLLFGLALAAIWSPGCLAEPPPPLAYGMDLSFWRVDLGKLSQCTKVRRNYTIAGSVFITRYDDPAIRDQVNEELRTMRRSGFRELRTHVFFGRGPKARDRFDLDSEKAKAARAVRMFVRLHITFSSQGPANPACRNKKWGDCFDADSVSDVIDFMSRVREGLEGVPIKLRFDLAPEKCSATNLPEPLRSNLTFYIEHIVSGYTKRFPRDETTVSCGIKRFRDGKRSIDAAYKLAGRVPSVYEVHAYRDHGRVSDRLLRDVRDAVAGSNIPMLVGETNYGDAEQLRSITKNLETAGGGLVAIYFWPLRNTDFNCHVDTTPPYRLPDALGRGEQDIGPRGKVSP